MRYGLGYFLGWIGTRTIVNCEIAAMGIIFRFSFYVLEKWLFRTVEITVSLSFHTIV